MSHFVFKLYYFRQTLSSEKSVVLFCSFLTSDWFSEHILAW